LNIEGQCLPECITYQNSIKNFNGICPICNRFYGSNLECHIGKEHKALTRDLKAVFQNILSTAPAANVSTATPTAIPTTPSTAPATATITAAKQNKATKMPTRIQHKRAAKKD
jgi:hypothetical protein